MMEALTSAEPSPTPAGAASMAPRLNVDLLRDAFSQVDLTTGIDMGNLLESIQPGAENAPQAVQQAFQMQGLNVLTAMAPLINQMVQRAVEQAVTASVRQTDHQQQSRDIVTAFVERHPHANNPVSLQLLSNLTGALIAANPARIDRAQILAGLENFMQGLSLATNKPQSQSGDIPQGAQTGFGGLFNR